MRKLDEGQWVLKHLRVAQETILEQAIAERCPMLDLPLVDQTVAHPHNRLLHLLR